MTGRGRRVAPIGDRPALCPLCATPLPSHAISCPSLDAFWIEKVAERLATDRREWAQEILRAAPAADGSSWTARGGAASRSWSATGSSTTACRRLRHARSGSTSAAGRSTAGPAGIRTSASSKWWNAGVDIIGMAAAIPADQHHGLIHDAYCPICRMWEKA